jgi:hypothetical protein
MVFKSRTAILSLLGVLMAAWVVAPTASAQGTNLDMTLTPPAIANLIPESGAATLKAAVHYGYQAGAVQGIPTGATFASVTVTFKPTCPPSILVTGPTTKILTVNPASQQTSAGGDVEGTFSITATREAPGLKTIKCNMTASISQPQAPAGTTVPPDASVDFTVSADYYALIQPKIAKKLVASGPDKQVPFSIELTNYGNARTQVNFEQGTKPTSGKWDILLPDPIILDSPYSGGEGKTVDTATVTVSSTYKNGWNNAKGSYQILMKVASADQPDKKGNDLNANILVRVRGVYVPGLEPFVMLASILGSALVLRLRKADE